MGRLRVIPRFKRQSGAAGNGADHSAEINATAAPAGTPKPASPLAEPTAPPPQARAAAPGAVRLPGDAPPPTPRPASSPAESARPAAETGAAAPGAPEPSAQPDQPGEQAKRERSPGFRTRGRMRRRLQYLRTARELSYRDLGGLTFDLYRFGGRREELMAAKLQRLLQIDTELRALERALDRRLPFTVLREAGVIACPRCAEVHSEEDRFCPHCGMPVAPDAERPLATAPSPPAPPPSAQDAPSASSAAPAPGAPPEQATSPGRAPMTRTSAPPARQVVTPPVAPPPAASPQVPPAGASPPPKATPAPSGPLPPAAGLRPAAEPSAQPGDRPPGAHATDRAGEAT